MVVVTPALTEDEEYEYVFGVGDVGVLVAIHTGGGEGSADADSASSALLKGGAGRFPSDTTTGTDVWDDDDDDDDDDDADDDDDDGSESFVSSAAACVGPRGGAFSFSLSASRNNGNMSERKQAALMSSLMRMRLLPSPLPPSV